MKDTDWEQKHQEKINLNKGERFSFLVSIHYKGTFLFFLKYTKWDDFSISQEIKEFIP